jgi:REP element-mobilizing transposase RayT
MRVLDMVETIRFTRGNLPHWMVADRPYFVTFRLAGTLPRDVVGELKQEREALLSIPNVDEEKWTELKRRQFARVDAILDAVSPRRAWLSKYEIAELVFENFAWLEQRGWRIYAAVIMLNHVHAVVRHTDGRNGELLGELGQYKSYTGDRANRILGRKGKFWAEEGFDHWCRDESKVIGACRYTCLNPVKAGLVKTWRDWSWVRCEEEYQPV